MSIYLEYPDETAVMLFCGVIWGISAICFTKGIDFLGIALLYGISMGISIIGGALFPLIIQPDRMAEIQFGSLGIGLFLSSLGILMITIGGRLRDRGTDMKNMNKGLLFAVFSGIGSALMNLGFGYGRNMSEAMNRAGIDASGVSAASWLLIIVGGVFAATCYCLPQIIKNRMIKGLPATQTVMTTVKLAATAVVWYAALCLYGIFTCRAGGSALVTGRVIFNALALIISNAWGMILGEWKGAGKALWFAVLGNMLMVISWLFLA